MQAPGSAPGRLEAARHAAASGRRDAALALLAPGLGDDATAGELLFASVLRLARDDYRLALELASRACDCIDGVDDQLQALRLLRRFEEPARMQALAASIDWRSWRAAPALAEACLLLSSVNLFDAARAALAALRHLRPGDPNAHYLDGLLCMFEGRREASLEALDAALRVEPRMANAHWLVAMQGDDASAAAHVQTMQRAWPAIRPGSEADAYMGYAMHRRLHALGQYRQAWSALERGMAAMRARSAYDPVAQAELFEQLQRFDPGCLPPLDGTPAASPRLIFIVGMFRSGTSLLERVVTRHGDVLDGGETYQFPAAMRYATDHACPWALDATILARAATCDFAEVRTRFLDYAAWRAGGRPVLTEKLPSNFLNLGFILHAFPEAKVLHLRRDPVDTCFSNLRTILPGAPYACDQSALADFALRYSELMAHWHAVAPGRILDVDYESFVSDPEREARRVLAFCGLGFSPTVLDLAAGGGHTTTASAADVRGGIVRGRGGAWRAYEAQLQPLLAGLGKAGER